MDKTKHPDLLLIATYTFMGFCWAGKAGTTFTEMIVCAVACLAQGIVVVMLENKGPPTYIGRFFAVIAATLIIISAEKYFSLCPSGIFTLFIAMVLPVAAGAMLVEGMYIYPSSDGKHKIKTALMCSSVLGARVFICLKIMGVAYT